MIHSRTICRGKHPSLNVDIPVIDPFKITNSEKNEILKMDSMISIVGRLATMAETKNVKARQDNDNSIASSQIVVLHFAKRDYDLIFPVVVKDLSTPLIECVKKARATNNFFSFKTTCRDRLKNGTGKISIICK